VNYGANLGENLGTQNQESKALCYDGPAAVNTSAGLFLLSELNKGASIKLC
jgi:hypothetical protein